MYRKVEDCKSKTSKEKVYKGDYIILKCEGYPVDPSVFSKEELPLFNILVLAQALTQLQKGNVIFGNRRVAGEDRSRV